MAFATKTDFTGLVAKSNGALLLRDDNPNHSNEVYEDTGTDGSIIVTEPYGEDAAPTNNFALAKDLELEVKLGAITTVNNQKFALESVSITTTGGSAPTISATSQLVEDGATDANSCVYDVGTIEVLKRHHAQILLDAFSFTGAGCELTTTTTTIGCTVNKDKLVGAVVSSDVVSGQIVVTGEILATGTAEPEITAGEGWTLVTLKPNAANPETAKKRFSFEVRKNLTKTTPTAA